MRLIKLFLAWNTSALGVFFPDQERKIPGNPEISEVFPTRKGLISNIPLFPSWERDHSMKFLTVYVMSVFCNTKIPGEILYIQFVSTANFPQ
jgi:hypothetical protein